MLGIDYNLLSKEGQEIQKLADETTTNSKTFKEKALLLPELTYGKQQLVVEVYDKGYKIDELALTVTVVGSVRFKTVPTAISFGNELQIIVARPNIQLFPWINH